MTISPIWHSRDEFTLLEIAYIACQLEPQDYFVARPPIVSRTYKDLWNCNGVDASIYDRTILVYNEHDSNGPGRYYTKTQAINFIDQLKLPNFFTMPSANDQIAKPEPSILGLHDPSHHGYSKELDIAIKAWLEVVGNRSEKPTGKSYKKLINEWLQKNHPNLKNEALKRISTLVNPQKTGGAPPSTKR
ncbi:hypothetical protein A1353_23055 [Methylomonas methanica]|uniref:Uncharacterized protein n=2 Tax=Methylomonas methanica TaxID=421 RepID=A0A177LXV6_METMH|nr:hypothetical protein A1353_23055 [Methylomonas methanica]